MIWGRWSESGDAEVWRWFRSCDFVGADLKKHSESFPMFNNQSPTVCSGDLGTIFMSWLLLLLSLRTFVSSDSLQTICQGVWGGGGWLGGWLCANVQIRRHCFWTTAEIPRIARYLKDAPADVRSLGHQKAQSQIIFTTPFLSVSSRCAF